MDLIGWLPWVKAGRVIDMPSSYCVSSVKASIDERMTNQSQWMKQVMRYCQFWSDYDKRKKKGKKLKVSQIRYYCHCRNLQIHDVQQDGEVANCVKCGVSTNLRPEKDEDGGYKFTFSMNDSQAVSFSYKVK